MQNGNWNSLAANAAGQAGGADEKRKRWRQRRWGGRSPRKVFRRRACGSEPRDRLQEQPEAPSKAQPAGKHACTPSRRPEIF